MHLPLFVPEPDACGIRGAGETRRWEVGKALIFDESQNAIVFIDGVNLVESTLDGLHNRVLSNAMPADANLLAYSENERSFYVSTNDSILSYEAGRSGLMPVVEEIQRPVSLRPWPMHRWAT